MDIKAYAYVESNDRTLCFGCAVRSIIEEKEDDYLSMNHYDLVLERGDTGDGNDMRKIPHCNRCGRMIDDHSIA